MQGICNNPKTAHTAKICAVLGKKFRWFGFFIYLCGLKSHKNKLITHKIQTIMSDIAQRVKAIIVDKLTVDENEVTPTAEFSKDLGADSLDTVELIMEFEKEFGINIPDEDAEKITTVGDAISYIESHQ